MRTKTRQQGSVFQRRERQADGTIKVSDRWSIKFRRSDGKQVVQVIGPRKREAVERLAEILTAMRAGHAVEKEITFADYVGQWLARRAASLKPSTARSFAGLLGTLPKPRGEGREYQSPVQAFGALSMDTIDAERMGSYLGTLTAAGLAPKSVNNLRGLLSTLFADAQSTGYCATNPTKHRLVPSAKVLKPGDRAEMIVPTSEQVSAMLSYLEGHDVRLYAFCVTLALTGCRPGEAAALQTKHLIPVSGQIRITQAYDPRARKLVMPKNGKRRTVDAGPQAFAALARVGDPTDPECFLMGPDFDFHALSKQWGRLQVAAGCGEWPLYSFRHYWASQMLASGESLAYVSRQLGHSKQSMTLDHYSRFLPDTRRARGADRLASELLGRGDGATLPVEAKPARPPAETSSNRATDASTH